ncbi:MAG: hypothetical protein ACRDGG_01415 [Anaerolineae bacterium]
MTATSTSPTALPGPHPMPVLGWRGNVLSFGLDPVAFMYRLNQTYFPPARACAWEPRLPCWR